MAVPMAITEITAVNWKSRDQAGFGFKPQRRPGNIELKPDG